MLISWLAPKRSGFHSSLARGAQINFLASNRFPLMLLLLRWDPTFFSNFRSSSNHWSSESNHSSFNDTCNHCLNFGEKCSSIMILYMFRNNPTKGQTGSGIYTSDGVTFKNILVAIFHFSILNDLGRFLKKMEWWKVTKKIIQRITLPSIAF